MGLGRSVGAAEDRDDVFNRDHKELIVRLEIDGDGVFRVEENFVVLPQRHVLVVFDHLGDGDDATGDGGDFSGIGEGDPSFGLPLGFILADENSVTDGLDVFERVVLFRGHAAPRQGTGCES